MEQNPSLAKHKRSFDDQGFAIVRNFVSPAVAKRLKEISLEDNAMRQHSHAVLDAAGRQSRLTLWYEPGNDVFGRLSCSDRLVAEMACFLDGDVSFFHAKLMQKLPKTGGAWEWHQDYGYWYGDGFLKPDMASCYVALDAATKENGCLQVIPKSHRHGRLDHGRIGEQTGADSDRVDALKKIYGTVYCKLGPGDALYFHSNLLHASGPNPSAHSRLGLISSFFRRDNESIADDPRYRNKVCPSIPHEAILDVQAPSDADKAFLEVKRQI